MFLQKSFKRTIKPKKCYKVNDCDEYSVTNCYCDVFILVAVSRKIRKMSRSLPLWAACLGAITLWAASAQAEYRVGIGKADTTGPAAEITFMGYASLTQKGSGIHMRQFSRSFIFEKDGSRVVFVSTDTGMMGTGVKREVIKRLQKDYGSLYDTTNVILSGTHTHSTPGGFLMDLLFDLTSFGFVQETFDALADGIVRSIRKAHENIQPARLFYSENQVTDAHINRSPTSYLLNPEEERNRYSGNTDTTMQQIKITTPDKELLGVINWFAIHPVSMNNTNKLISSDNVGYAAQLTEKAINPKGTLAGKGKIVAAFASSNLGDISPNTKGPRCEQTGDYCDMYTSRCPEGECYASGPGKDMFESTKIIGERLAQGAIDMLEGTDQEITGPVKVIHQFVDMPEERVPDYDPIHGTFNQDKIVSGCLAAMGYSFAAGTTDGPGSFIFSQGTTTGNPLWNLVGGLLARPTRDDVACHAPKPILLMTGRVSLPYEWQPKIVATQLAMIGNVAIAAMPGEFTTMAGRRVRGVIRRHLEENGGNNVQVILAGLSNTYSDYVVTPEEYQAQRYEAASTIYGPHTLTIYLNKYKELCDALIKNTELPPGPTPPNFEDKLISLAKPVVYDSAGFFKSFGDVITQPSSSYHPGQVARAVFISGHPRNDVQQESDFGTVEKLNSNGQWEVKYNDASWETKYIWSRVNGILGTSSAEIQWEIPEDVEPGTYRIHHRGHAKVLFRIKLYHGISKTFQVTNPVLAM